MGQLVRILQAVGGHVRQDRLLAQVVADDLGHVGVGELVVGDPVADGVGDGDVAGPGRVEDARAADERIGAEVQRVEELVVDPAVHHVHPLLAGRGPHVDDPVPADQVPAFDQFDAHLAGQEGVLEVGRVVHARG